MLVHPKPSQRMRYAAEVVFHDWHGLTVEWSAHGAIEGWVEARVGDAVVSRWPVHAVARDETRPEDQPEVLWHTWSVDSPKHGPCVLPLPCATAKEKDEGMGFDVLGAALHGLTCWSEQADEVARDMHGRPLPMEIDGQPIQWNGHRWPMSQRHRMPWVECMALLLVEAWGLSDDRDSTFGWKPTFDVDVAFCHLGRPRWKSHLLQCRDVLLGRWQTVSMRRRVLSGKSKDPYDTYAWIKDFHRNEALTWYVLAAKRRRPYDVGLDPKSPALSGLRESLTHHEGGALVRWHPGHGAMSSEEDLLQERREALQWTRGDHRGIRAHFLRSEPGEAWRTWERLGVEEDCSLGWSREVGFRGGVSRPYMVFDLASNARLQLTVEPIAVMDSALQAGLNVRPEAVMDVVTPMMDVVRDVGGSWVICWHNTSVSERDGWKGWQAAYVSMVQRARSMGHQTHDHA